MSWNFKPGDKVVCVDDDLHDDWPQNRDKRRSLNGLKRGAEYTVESCGVFPTCSAVPVIWVAELQHVVGYAARRFRPIDDFKADLSWVTDILREAEQNTPTKIEAEVMEALGHLLAGRE